ncbi:GntR family transcriptional regulator [Streptomyces sp. NPDC048496]|uniref:GntR family transcriptional regulator n=1 Tax=Streptomyces sp. NPDC048496 TaxID=3365558 RepID=UPI00371A5174
MPGPRRAHALPGVGRTAKGLAEILQGRVETGTYVAGELIPSTVALAAEFDVSTSTMRKALVALIEDGTLWAEPGMGTYARDEKPPSQHVRGVLS